MTNLFNHRYFQESMLRELGRAERYKHSVALIMFDIDGFKMINDRYGHQFGDTVLRTIGNHILRQARTSDIVARYGGEEFAVILPETNLAGAKAKAERARQLIEELEIKIDQISLRVTISAGVAAHEPTQPVTKDKLIDGADRALYRSKADGKNRVTAWQWRNFVTVSKP
jgi:diguanylate cyclase (GGDEF)-like protein